MTALEAFLVALYDDVSEAETAALRHGQERLAALLAADAVPRDVALPVYHASEVEVTLDVRLEAEAGDDGPRLVVGEADPDDGSTLRLTVDLFELVDAGDLQDLDLDDLPDGGPAAGGPDRGAVDPRRRPVTDVRGIGPTYAARLQSHDVETLGDLVALSPEAVADAVSGERVDVSADTVEDWLEAARGLEAVLPEGETDRPVELVDGIGPTYGRRLREHDVTTLADLLQQDPGALADRVSTEELTVSAEQAAGWLEQAERLIVDEASLDTAADRRASGEPNRTDDDPRPNREPEDGTDANRPTDDGTDRQPDEGSRPDEEGGDA